MDYPLSETERERDLVSRDEPKSRYGLDHARLRSMIERGVGKLPNGWTRADMLAHIDARNRGDRSPLAPRAPSRAPAHAERERLEREIARLEIALGVPGAGDDVMLALAARRRQLAQLAR